MEGLIMDKIILKEKNVYGNDLLYPITFQAQLETLTGKKTLNRADIIALKVLGLKVYTQSELYDIQENKV